MDGLSCGLMSTIFTLLQYSNTFVSFREVTISLSQVGNREILRSIKSAIVSLSCPRHSSMASITMYHLSDGLFRNALKGISTANEPPLVLLLLQWQNYLCSLCPFRLMIFTGLLPWPLCTFRQVWLNSGEKL